MHGINKQTQAGSESCSYEAIKKQTIINIIHSNKYLYFGRKMRFSFSFVFLSAVGYQYHNYVPK